MSFKRILKRALLVFLLALLALALSAAGIALFFPWNWAAAKVTRFVADSTGIEISFKHLDVTDFSKLRIEDLDVLVQNGSTRILHVMEVRAELDTWTLITSGKVIVDSVQIESPSIFLVEHDGTWNLAETLEAIEGPAKRPIAPAPKEVEKNAGSAKFVMKDLAIEDLSLQVRKKDFHLGVEHIGLHGSFAMAGDESHIRAELSVTGSKNMHVEFVGPEKPVQSLTAGLGLYAKLVIENLKKLSGSIDMRLDLSEASKTLPGVPGTMSLASGIEWDSAKALAALNDLWAGIDGQKVLSGRVKATDLDTLPGLEVEVKELTLDLDRFNRLADLIAGLKDLHGRVTGRDIEVSIPGGRPALAAILARADVSGGFTFEGVGLAYKEPGIALKDLTGIISVSYRRHTKRRLDAAWDVRASGIAVESAFFEGMRLKGGGWADSKQRLAVESLMSASMVAVRSGTKTYRTAGIELHASLLVDPERKRLHASKLGMRLGRVGRVFCSKSHFRLDTGEAALNCKVGPMDLAAGLEIARAVGLPHKLDDLAVSGKVEGDIEFHGNLFSLAGLEGVSGLHGLKGMTSTHVRASNVSAAFPGLEFVGGKLDLLLRGPLSHPDLSARLSLDAIRSLSSRLSLEGLDAAISLKNENSQVKVSLQAASKDFTCGDMKLRVRRGSTDIQTFLPYPFTPQELRHAVLRTKVTARELDQNGISLNASAIELDANVKLAGDAFPGIEGILATDKVSMAGPGLSAGSLRAEIALVTSERNNMSLQLKASSGETSLKAGGIGELGKLSLHGTLDILEDFSRISVHEVRIDVPSRKFNITLSSSLSDTGKGLDLVAFSADAVLDSKDWTELYHRVWYRGRCSITVDARPRDKRTLSAKARFSPADLSLKVGDFIEAEDIKGTISMRQDFKFVPGIEPVLGSDSGDGSFNKMPADQMEAYRRRSLSFSKLTVKGVTLNNGELDLGLENGTLRVANMQADLLGGSVVGAVSVGLGNGPGDLFLDADLQATALDLGLLVGDENGSEGESQVSGALKLSMKLKEKFLFAKLQLTEIGPKMLDRALRLVNKDGSNLSIEEVRSKLIEYGLKPKLVSTRIKHGNLGIDIRMNKDKVIGLGRIAADQIESISREQLKRIPIASLLESDLFVPLQRALWGGKARSRK